MHVPSDAETVFGLRILDRVAAGDGAAGFHGLIAVSYTHLSRGGNSSPARWEAISMKGPLPAWTR